MAEGTGVDERVDLDEDNYMEEIDDEVEEQLSDDAEDTGGDAIGEENDEDEYDETQSGEKDKSPEEDREHVDAESAEDEEKVTPITEEEKEKHAQLLSLPANGSEIFMGGLPRDVVEEDLRDLCEPIGEIFEVRLMKDRDSGEGKGYAFVAFKSKEFAQKAIDALHSKEFKGKTLRCSLAETKNRLFIGNVPKSWTEDEFRKVIEGVGPGVENIELIKDPQISSRNRGFAFILYYNNACADHSRLKMSNPNFKLDGNSPTVTWADPKSSPDNSAAAQVKALYVKNIPENTTTEQLKEIFQQHGDVTKVVMPPGKAGKRDFGFIHYAERSSALNAVKDTEKYEINGQLLEVVLAKPQTDKKYDNAYSYGAGAPLSHLPSPMYGGYGVSPYGSVSNGLSVNASFQQPMIYGRGPMPSGMHMVPMVLPDGRIGYVLQQPGVQMQQQQQQQQPRPRRGDRSNGQSGGRGGSGGGGGDDGGRSRRYRPY